MVFLGIITDPHSYGVAVLSRLFASPASPALLSYSNCTFAKQVAPGNEAGSFFYLCKPHAGFFGG